MNNQLILDQFAFQRSYLSLLVDDVPEERLTEQPGGVRNHPAWHIGHLALVSDRFAEMLGVPSGLDGSWKDRFAPGTVPVAERSAYPSKAELLRVLDERRAALADAMGRAGMDVMAKPNPNQRLAAFLPTIGHAINFGAICHESTHLGALAVWRKAAGMVEALSKLPR
jgi:hypothetical protein